MKRFIISAISLIAVFIVFSSCNDAGKQKPAFDLALAKKQIDSVNQQFAAAFSREDSAGVANFYTEDAKMMGSNEPAVVGRKAIQAQVSNYIKGGVTKFDIKTIDVWGNEDLLGEEGTVVVKTKDNKQIDQGKYIVLWKKLDGKWKLFRDIFNSNLPLPAAK